MRKLARVIFNVLAALSLLLCVAACVLWVRSYRVSDEFTWVFPREWLVVTACRGRAAFSYNTFEGEDFYTASYSEWLERHNPKDLPHSMRSKTGFLLRNVSAGG